MIALLGELHFKCTHFLKALRENVVLDFLLSNVWLTASCSVIYNDRLLCERCLLVFLEETTWGFCDAVFNAACNIYKKCPALLLVKNIASPVSI